MTTPYRTSTSSYSRFFPPFQGAVRALVIACVAVYALQVALAVISPDGSIGGGPGLETQLIRLFGLVPVFFLHGWIWQVVTYLFLHGDPFHILLNMFVLWMFGSSLEEDWGPRRFLFYYFFTGIGAGLLSVVVAIHSATPTIGASGAIYGVLLAFGVLHPNRNVYMWGIIPVKAKWLVLAFGIVALVSSWGASGDGIAHIAHLGGMLFGLAYLKRVWRVRELYKEIRWRLRRRRFQVIERGRGPGGNGDPRWPYH